jgi:hypothetical protein
VKKRFVRAAALLAVLAAALYASAPPARQILYGAADDGSVPGVLHVHSNRSDGGGSPDEVARAAAREGLKFIVFTDHGDGTRPADPPVYRSGVLCIDAVEISTTAGHYIALGMQTAPYPLGGEPRDVVEDVRRLGGFGIAAHPDSPKPELQWGDWDAPMDGVELINPDTGWRVRVAEPGITPMLGVLAALASYPFVPEESIASVLADPSPNIRRWLALNERRRVVGLSGVDAHAKLAFWDVEPGDNRFTLPFPGYRPAFRTVSVHVRPDQPLTGDASRDWDAILQAIRDGHLYTVVDAVATPPSFEFSATSDGRTVHQGGELDSGQPVRLRIRTNAPGEFSTTLWEGDRVLTTGSRDGEFTVLVPGGPGVYRVEIRAANRAGEPIWIISNPIYVRAAAAPAPIETSADARTERGPQDPAVGPPEGLLFPASPNGWTVEHDGASKADLEIRDGAMELDYTLGPDPGTRPRVAIAAPPHELAPNDRLLLRLRADRPMRLSIQLRTGAAGGREERWQRSVFVDAVERDVTVAFDDMRSVGATRSERPPLEARPSVILVVDTTNTKAGSTGTLTIRQVALGRAATSRAGTR